MKFFMLLCALYRRLVGTKFLIRNKQWYTTQGSHRGRLALVPNNLSHEMSSSIIRFESHRECLSALKICFAALNVPPETLAKFTKALREKRLTHPSENIDCIIGYITHHCMCCIASRGDVIPY